MQAFSLTRTTELDAATAAGRQDAAAFIAGGTDLMQLMKQNVERPRSLVDLAGLKLDAIEQAADGTLRIGALVTMNAIAADPRVRAGWPAISQALLLSAMPQIRNMGTAGGNLLQRTRCLYFRDPGFAACNKRSPGSGCSAIGGDNRMLAIYGVSDQCIATHPSDMPVALMAFGASVEIHGAGGPRTVPIGDFYRTPGHTPHVETVLQPGDVITAILVPPSAAARRSTYLKVRDRASFEFALVSAAVGLDVQGGAVRDARVALGGVGTMPWRMPQMEQALIGRPADDATFQAAAALANDGAVPQSANGFKVELARRTVLRALQTVVAA